MSTINKIEVITDGGHEFAHYFVDGVKLTPERSLEVFNHSPDGFAWGYLGSAPAQLALGILLACDVPEEDAVRTHQTFKEQHVAVHDQEKGWRIELDVRDWVQQELYRRGELE